MSKQFVDTIIFARYVLPIHPMKVYENMALIIDEGKIVNLIPAEDVIIEYLAAEEIFLDHHVLMPGLVNTHNHAAMSLLRGLADDAPLEEWLNDHIWPAEVEHVSDSFVRLGAQLAIAEMVRSGTTCFSDMYFYPNATAEAVDKSGVRAQICATLLDLPTKEAQTPEEYLAIADGLISNYQHHPRISPALGPHAPYTVSDDSFSKVKELSDKYQVPMQIHVHETQKEVDDSVAQLNKRPITRLDELGLLTPHTQLVHMTALDDDDIARVKKSGASIVHCPRSNLKLASGFCDITQLAKEGINISIGTDGAASNNALDMFSEMQYAAMLAKAVSSDATSIPAETALHMATLGGAKALGLDALIGSLETGKAADVIAIDMSQLEQMPHLSVISQLVYTQVGHLCTDAWVDGQAVMRNRELSHLNLNELMDEANEVLQTLAKFKKVQTAG